MTERTPHHPDRPLTHALHRAATERGLRSGDTLPDVPELFALVRDMPYARADTHEPAGIIAGWRGTCSTKHELLAALLAEAGLRSTVMACTQEIRPPADAPAELLALSGGQPVVDVHNYLVVHAPQGDMTVDATWPLAAAAAGLPVNAAWEWGQDQVIACTPLDTWAVPEGESVAAFKDRVLRERYTSQELERREVFIQGVGRLFLAPSR
ncbi:hypothetical protein [Deinococcus sp. 6GRE01]|uniref:hypothetical protein n=1 Tax=Deinococcus sp. 6GRE01 TaxID=2745873 RepID=UPI001E4D00A4|nr:hypothetical protein [Deinococcus sp. 6GRE01]MCD0159644.1 hypothetical protein [Deinococcus sp. 6GRE01]